MTAIRVIIPVKRFAEAKRRLAPILGEAERRALARAMLEDVLAAATAAEGIAEIVVATSEPIASRLAISAGCTAFDDGGASMNAAIAGARDAMTLPCAVLVVPADIPLLRAGLIAAAASHLSKPRSVVLAPAWRDGGTNLMGCNPAGLIAPSFGPDSFARHCRLAEEAGCKPLILRDQRLARDIDTIADLTDLPADRLGSKTLRYLDSIRRTIDSAVWGRAS